MTVHETNSAGIKKLTKRIKETGALYARRPEVEVQLGRLISAEPARIVGMLKTPERRSDDYLFDETIVYLLREPQTDPNFREALYAELNGRIWKLLYKYYSRFDEPSDFQDFGQQVELKIIEKIFGAETDAADYAQVNFGDFVATLAAVAWRGIFSKLNKERETFHHERNDEEDRSEPEFASHEISADRRLVLREGLGKLPPQIRTVAALLLDGWQIESRDENEPTISRYCNVSSRTIRNWLSEARALLAGYEGEIR